MARRRLLLFEIDSGSCLSRGLGRLILTSLFFVSLSGNLKAKVSIMPTSDEREEILEDLLHSS